MTAQWRGPRWLKPLFGGAEDSIFHRATAVQLTHRDVPDALLKLRYLESVSLSGCRMSRDELDRLNRRRSLKSLSLHDNQLEDSNHPAVAASPIPAWQKLDWGEKTNKSLCQVDSSGSGFACPSSLPTVE